MDLTMASREKQQETPQGYDHCYKKKGRDQLGPGLSRAQFTEIWVAGAGPQFQLVGCHRSSFYLFSALPPAGACIPGAPFGPYSVSMSGRGVLPAPAV